MAQDIKFVFELLDRASSNAKKIASAMREVENQVNALKGGQEKAEKTSNGFFGGLVKVRSELTFAIDPLRAVTGALSMLGSAAIGAGEAVAGVVIDAGKFAVDALAFKESTLASFKLILGTEEAADRVFRKAVDFGAKTPFETKQVLDSFKQLLGAGFTEQQVPIVFQALGDVAAASGFDPMAMPMITNQLAQVKGKGKLMMEDLRAIVNWTGKAGVGYEKIFDAIGKKLGVASTAVSDLMAAGKVDANAGLFGILKAIQDRSGGQVGNVMLEQSKTLTGLLSTLRSLPSDVFMKMDLKAFTGFEQIKSTVENVIKVFQDGTPLADRFGKSVQKAFNTLAGDLFEGFAGPDGEKTLTGFFMHAFDVFDSFVTGVRVGVAFIKGAFEGFAEAFGWDEIFKGEMTPEQLKSLLEEMAVRGKSFGYALAGVAESLADIVQSFLTMRNLIRGEGWGDFLLGGVGNANKGGEMNWGKFLFEGLPGTGGLWDDEKTMQGVGSDAIKGIEKGARTEGRMHSPSELMADLGANLIQGLALGVSGFGEVDAQRFTGATATGPTTPAGRPTLMFAPGSIVIDARGGDAQEIASALREAVLSEFATALEGLAIEGGQA